MVGVVVADLGTGNLRSVAKAVEHVAGRESVRIGDTAADIRGASKLILPGQGAIGTWMAQLADHHLRASVTDALATVPVLGICLGQHALYSNSTENNGVTCLGLLQGRISRFGESFALDAALKIPHMGWNNVVQSQPHPLWQGIDDASRFYFVHSYHVDGADPRHVVGTTVYGSAFASASARDNVFATQFHPEKSGAAGLRLIANFLNWDGEWST